MGEVQFVAIIAAVPLGLLLCALVHVIAGAVTGRKNGGALGHGDAGLLLSLYVRQIPAALIPWCVIPLLFALGRVRPQLSRSHGIDILAWLDLGEVFPSTPIYVLLAVLDVGLCYTVLFASRRLHTGIPPLAGPVAIANYLVAGAYICVVGWATMLALLYVVMLGYG